MKWVTTVASIAAVIVTASLCSAAQEGSKPQEKSPRGTASKSSAAARGKHYTLPATKENVQWGWLDPTEKPRLTINSGDVVSIETWYHALDAIKPTSSDLNVSGPPMDELARLRKANPGGGPHSVTGPIYIEGAEPGDTLEIRILKIVPKEIWTELQLARQGIPHGVTAKRISRGFCSLLQA